MCAKYTDIDDGINQHVDLNYLYNNTKFFCNWECYNAFSDYCCRRYVSKAEFNIEFSESEEKKI